jgi:sugar phosphate isomerase/epimerase
VTVRFRHPDGTLVHVAYCTNVHPAQDLDGVLDQLARYAEPVRHRLGTDVLGVGLWLAAPLAARLAADAGPLRAELDRRGLEVVTLNAFPYESFQAAEVKHSVYSPNWTDERRLRYTLDCASVLAALLPPDAARGSISTLPFGWRAGWSAEDTREALLNLARLTAELAGRTGRVIRIGLEPEPGCVLEHTKDAAELLAGTDLGVCLDMCHLAVGFEDPGVAASIGVPIVKAQLSCALHADDPADPATTSALARFAEPRFLHQVRTATGAPADDLPDALAGAVPPTEPWRVHFHLPPHVDPPEPLRSTSAYLRDCLAVLFGGPTALVDHVEVETYTWPVLPTGDDDLVAGIAGELAWTAEELRALGLLEES